MATVLVTGANRGIGLEFVQQLLNRNDRVIATCRDFVAAADLQTLKSENPELELLQLDATSDESIDQFASSLKGVAIDIFINNAGVYGPRDAQFGNVTSESWAIVMQVNAIAPLLLTQVLIDNFAKGKGKKLVYITSKMGSIEDNQGGGSYVYRSSKSALNAVVKSIAVDLGREGISAAVLHPGWVQTDMGGPSALIDTQTSVSGMLSVIDNLDSENTGSFFNYDGTIIPW
jgi:NAD(P)-dependent dehydrogenase (short-subunit alcohol dehydrogenase family)